MYTASETSTIALVVLVACAILGWGFYRAKALGKLGLLTWLQSVVLIAPWLLFFGLFAAGIYLNLVGILFLVVASTVAYIAINNRLRTQTQTKPSLTPPTPTNETITPSKPPEQTIVPIPSDDMVAIRGIFSIDTYFAVETIPYQEGVIIKGNLRGEPEAVHKKLTASLQEKLSDRYRLFLVENVDAKPVVIILPRSADVRPVTVSQYILAVGLIIATMATIFETAGILLGFDFFTHLERFTEVLPIGIGIIAILASHELAHYFVARRYQVKLSPPFFLPTLQLGSFGAITRFASLVPHRQALFDIAFAGPAAGGLLSLLLLIVGLLLSHPGSLFQVPTEFFQGSILVGTLARVIIGANLHDSLVDVNPLTVIGWLGLVITALNLMPAGVLDGGRIVQAIYGRKTAGRATIATLIILAVASLANPVAMYWAIAILFLQRDLERPSLNEITEPDDARAALGLLALFLMICVLLPLTPALAGRLGIGG
ncbi:site-2 protease family protein [Synechocystis sp. PCC 7509]|uniref:site-2 protease family protein n=1 Tax=Synechocystis sp. PCC 7509 TaxID=927677 RepID=UPI0002AC8B43|nr:site-2 protease family protein [Synechocystis sp. PCC 7509]